MQTGTGVALCKRACTQLIGLGLNIAGTTSGSDTHTDGASSLEDSSSHADGTCPASIPAIAHFFDKSQTLALAWRSLAPRAGQLELLAVPPSVCMSGTAQEKPSSEHNSDSSERARLSTSVGGGGGDALTPRRASGSPRRSEEISDLEDGLARDPGRSSSGESDADDRAHGRMPPWGPQRGPPGPGRRANAGTSRLAEPQLPSSTINPGS